MFDEADVGDAAFEVGVAFADEGRFYLGGGLRGQMEAREFIDFIAGAIADADDLVDEVVGGDVDDAFAAFADHARS